MTELHYEQMTPNAVEASDAATLYEELRKRFDAATTADEARAVVAEWDEFRDRVETWGALVSARFSQMTTDETRATAKETFDQTAPKLLEYSNDFVRHMLASPWFADLESDLGAHAFRIWNADLKSYSPEIEDETVEVSKLCDEYSTLVGGATVEFDGETLNLPRLTKFAESPDRDIRHRATKTRWEWFGQHAETFDGIYDRLVELRHGMARKLGFEDYRPLGYLQMQRTDYGPDDVARYREQVVAHVVPLCARIRAKQVRDLGIDSLKVWDEKVFDVRGNPEPSQDPSVLIASAHKMFDEMGEPFGSFYNMLETRGLTDLVTRDGKGAGGFCTAFADYGVPFIFANFNGTTHDVEVFTHEVGHAFQWYRSRDLTPTDYRQPTAEACEIHSMSLEYLTWPHMEKFFGEDADRFRKLHLTQSLCFLPYGCCVDHFQHEVYEKPDMSPEERNQTWLRLEKLYMPWRDHGDCERAAAGAAWQQQLHIYQIPFYYIDYTLALACALQFWVRSEEDPKRAMQDYIALCDRGGRMPFQELARSAGLVSPFDDGALAGVVAPAIETLDL